MKQFKLTFLLIVLMSMVGAKASAHDIEVKNADGKTIYYTYMNNETELAVSYRGSSYSSYSNEYSGVVNIPESVIYGGKTYPVTSIGSYAFWNCSGLTSVTIPNSVTSIGKDAFSGCTGLTSVTIPNSVTSIGESTFYRCYGLRSIIIPNSVTSIGSGVFDESNIKKVIWLPSTPPSGYDKVGGKVNYVPNEFYSLLSNITVYPYLSSMFEVDGIKYVPVSPSEKTCDAIDCVYDTSVDNVKIGNTVTYRGVVMTVKNVKPYMCYYNTYIKNVKVECDRSIGNYAFSHCYGLTSVIISNSVTSIGHYAFYKCSALTSVTIGNSVTSIGRSAFYNCSGLTSVTIPNSVTSIGDDAFSGCSGLTSVIIPNSLTSIGQSAFNGCSGLTSVTIPNSVTSIGSSAFSSCSGLTSVTIPNSVTSIGSYAFSSCKGLTSLTIPNSVTSIGSYAFSGCSGLTSVTINSNAIASKNYTSSSSLKDIFGSQVNQYVLGDSVTSIGKYAFSGCSGLTSVYIPDSVKTIGNYTFQNCSGLTSVTIGNSVTNIGSSAFAGCTNITKLTSCATTPPICGTQALNDINKWDCSLFVPTGSLSAYQAADQWKDFFFIEESDVTAINRIYDDEAEGRIIGIYDLNGRKLERLQRGMNIVRMSDGTTKKIVVK